MATGCRAAELLGSRAVPYPNEMMLAIDILQLEHFAPKERRIASGQLHVLITQLQHTDSLVMRRWQLQLGALHQHHRPIRTKGSLRIGQGARTH